MFLKMFLLLETCLLRDKQLKHFCISMDTRKIEYISNI